MQPVAARAATTLAVRRAGYSAAEAYRLSSAWGAAHLQGSSASLPVTAFAKLAPTHPSCTSRSFSTGSAKVAKTLQAEIKHEEDQYEQSKEITKFLKQEDWRFVESDGDVNMALERETGGKLLRIEFQLTSPFDPMAEEEGEDGFQQESTEFMIAVEDKATGSGILFYCSTQASPDGADNRYAIGNLKSFSNAEDKALASGYNGPEFDDLDEKLQEGFDEYLGTLGMSPKVCDFIDAMALDKEQREYIRWLKLSKSFFDV